MTFGIKSYYSIQYSISMEIHSQWKETDIFIVTCHRDSIIQNHIAIYRKKENWSKDNKLTVGKVLPCLFKWSTFYIHMYSFGRCFNYDLFDYITDYDSLCFYSLQNWVVSYWECNYQNCVEYKPPEQHEFMFILYIKHHNTKYSMSLSDLMLHCVKFCCIQWKRM